MIDSDFTIGFKQGQEHGIQIMQEKIEDIKAEIEQRMDGYEHITKDAVFAIIDKHTKGE